MITAITGKSGSGKSFIAHLLIESKAWLTYTTLIDMDEIVKDAYRTNIEVINTITYLLPDTWVESRIDRNILRKFLVDNPPLRERIEDFLFATLILPRIEETRKAERENLIVDGVLPKYLHHFDQVIYVERRKEDRIKDLKEKRNRTDEQSKEIDILQKDMFPTMLKER